jgi:poly(A) polymerase
VDPLLREKSIVSEICPVECRKGAVQVLTLLRDAGFDAYFAGGCVRDSLLSNPPTEYDIATSATPDDIKVIFPKARSVGESFGVMLVRKNEHMYDIATFRSDGPYSDHRHPDDIQFSDDKHDALRRDFTINGMFEDPINEKIIDYVGGRDDIENHIIRAIGDPLQRIGEDHLRMLRAVRFAARFSFSIDSETSEAIRQLAPELAGISRERIGEELKKMLTDPNRGVAAWELQYLGLDRVIFAEQSCMNAPTRLGRLPASSSYATALAAWMIDRHTSEANVQEVASQWRSQLLLSNRVYEELRTILSLHQEFSMWDSLGTAKQKRTASSDQSIGALAIMQAEDRAGFVHVNRVIAHLKQTGLAPEHLITGHDLLEAGVPPSSTIGNVLEAVYDAQLEGSVTSRQDALAFAMTIYQDFKDS